LFLQSQPYWLWGTSTQAPVQYLSFSS
jgi:hypothetical protein